MRRSSLGTVLLVLFLDLVGFSIVFPMFAHILEWYGAQGGGLLTDLNAGIDSLFGLSGEEVGMRHAAFFGGMLAGLYSIIQFLVTPFWGRLSDRIGRKPVLLATVVLNALGYLLWIFSGSFTLFVVSRIICGFASGNISVASAAVADLSTEKDRAKAMGLMGAAIGLGFIAGPALGATFALMPQPSGDGGAFALNPFSFPAAIAFALSVFNVIWILRRLEETRPESGAPSRSVRSINPLRFFRRDLGEGIATLNFAYLVFMVGFAGFEGTLVFLLVEKLDYVPGSVGLCMVWIGFCSAMIQGGVVRRVVAKTGERKLARLGMLLLIPGYVICGIVAWNETEVLMWLGVTLLAFGVGFLSPTLAAMVSVRSSKNTQGEAMGSYRSVGALGRALGPILAAVLYFRFGAGAPYLAAAGLAVIPLVMISSRRLDDAAQANPA